MLFPSGPQRNPSEPSRHSPKKPHPHEQIISLPLQQAALHVASNTPLRTMRLQKIKKKTPPQTATSVPSSAECIPSAIREQAKPLTPCIKPSSLTNPATPNQTEPIQTKPKEKMALGGECFCLTSSSRQRSGTFHTTSYLGKVTRCLV